MTQATPRIAIAIPSSGEKVPEIQSLTSRVQRLQETVDGWSSGMVWATIFAGVAAAALAPNDPEVDALAEQILLSMKGADWVPSVMIGTASGSRAVRGIAIDVAPHSSDATKRSAAALAEALRKDDLEVQGPSTFDFRVYGLALTSGQQDQHATMRMTIGRKR